jgi:hypothetical protein
MAETSMLPVRKPRPVYVSASRHRRDFWSWQYWPFDHEPTCQPGDWLMVRQGRIVVARATILYVEPAILASRPERNLPERQIWKVWWDQASLEDLRPLQTDIADPEAVATLEARPPRPPRKRGVTCAWCQEPVKSNEPYMHMPNRDRFHRACAIWPLLGQAAPDAHAGLTRRQAAEVAYRRALPREGDHA